LGHIVSFAMPETEMNRLTSMLNAITTKRSFGSLQFDYKAIEDLAGRKSTVSKSWSKNIKIGY